jgi:hypothetical protein
LALFTRRPDDKRAMDVESELWLAAKLRCATKEVMLVLMVEDINYSLRYKLTRASLPTL